MVTQAGGMDVNAMMQRVRRLLTLDTSVFEEVRTDRDATIPAIVVAAVSTLLFAIGGWLWWVFQDSTDNYAGSGEMLMKSVIFGSILSLVLWAVWLGITYILLTQVFGARADVNELVRVMGFAAAPLAIGLLMFIPMLEFAIGATAVAMLLGANLIAVQTATDAPAGRVFAAVSAGFLIWAIILGLFVGDDNILAPGFFIFEWPIEAIRG